jgi:hypothetical protein
MGSDLDQLEMQSPRPVDEIQIKILESDVNIPNCAISEHGLVMHTMSTDIDHLSVLTCYTVQNTTTSRYRNSAFPLSVEVVYRGGHGPAPQFKLGDSPRIQMNPTSGGSCRHSLNSRTSQSNELQ